MNRYIRFFPISLFLENGDRGSIESRVVPGLALDLEATIDLDLGRVLMVLQSRLTTQEHQQLIDRLASFQ